MHSFGRSGGMVARVSDVVALPERLQRARGLAGLTQEQAARRLGVSVGTIARWEQGRGGPSSANFHRAMGLYGLDEQSQLRELRERLDALEREVARLTGLLAQDAQDA